MSSGYKEHSGPDYLPFFCLTPVFRTRQWPRVGDASQMLCATLVSGYTFSVPRKCWLKECFWPLSATVVVATTLGYSQASADQSALHGDTPSFGRPIPIDTVSVVVRVDSRSLAPDQTEFMKHNIRAVLSKRYAAQYSIENRTFNLTMPENKAMIYYVVAIDGFGEDCIVSVAGWLINGVENTTETLQSPLSALVNCPVTPLTVLGLIEK